MTLSGESYSADRIENMSSRELRLHLDADLTRPGHAYIELQPGGIWDGHLRAVRFEGTILLETR